MTKTEHANHLQGVKSWLEVLQTGKAEAIEAVKVAMQVVVSNYEDMRYCEGCKQMIPSKDMENSRFCKLCVAVMDYQDEAWTVTEKDLRLVI